MAVNFSDGLWGGILYATTAWIISLCLVIRRVNMEIQITFHQMNYLSKLSSMPQKLGKLEKFYNRVTDMQVVLEVNKLQHMVML